MENVINDQFTLRLIIVIALGTATATATTTILMLQQSVYAYSMAMPGPAITSENIYIAWDVIRASIDGGKNLGEKINLSSTTASNSTNVAESVAVTWWQTNETNDIPVIRVSSEDFWKTFGPLLELSTNGTIEEDG